MNFDLIDTMRRGFARNPLVGTSLLLLFAMWHSRRSRTRPVLHEDGHAQRKQLLRHEMFNRRASRVSERADGASVRAADNRLKAVGHDMRNRLSAITYAVGVLRRDAGAAAASDACAIIERQSARLSQLVTEMLALAAAPRLRQEQPTPTRRPGVLATDTQLARPTNAPAAEAGSSRDRGAAGRDANRKPALPSALLIGEDADAMAAPLKVLLETGCRLTCSTPGHAGLRALMEHHPDIAIVAVGLAPGGLEIATRARAAGYAGRLVALSPSGEDSDARLSLKAGFDAHLGTPLNAEALQHELRQVP